VLHLRRCSRFYSSFFCSSSANVTANELLKSVRRAIPIYCQRQKCSPGNVVSGSIRLMHILAGVRWRGSVKWECGHWKWRFSLLSFTVFRTFYTHGQLATRPISRDTTVNDFSLGCHFHVHFSSLCLAFASHGHSAIAELLVIMLLLLSISYGGE